MQHLEGSCTPVLYIGRTALKVYYTICVKDFSMRLLLLENSGTRNNNIMH
jgi:hypothetical protein